MGLLVFGSSAKEFIHLFAHHHDTVHHHDHICPDGETHLEAEHHHCAFLHFWLDNFANDAHIIMAWFAEGELNILQNSAILAVFIPEPIGIVALRGPPAPAIV